jgi:hypothetical protein
MGSDYCTGHSTVHLAIIQYRKTSCPELGVDLGTVRQRSWERLDDVCRVKRTMGTDHAALLLVDNEVKGIKGISFFQRTLTRIYCVYI